MINNPLYTLFAILCAISLIVTFLMLCTFLYIGYKYLDVIVENLKNCIIVEQRKFLLRMGIWGRVVFVGSVAGFLAFPNYLTKKGALSAEDVNEFPRDLKKMLVALHHINWMVLLAAFIFTSGALAFR